MRTSSEGFHLNIIEPRKILLDMVISYESILVYIYNPYRSIMQVLGESAPDLFQETFILRLYV